jgi:sugar phosphate isomerase/epimerase
MKIGVRCNPLHLKEDFPALVQWLADNDFDAVDLMSPDPADKDLCDKAGLAVGSFDAPSLRKTLSEDESERAEAAESLKAEVSQAAGAGLTTLFAVFAPPNKALPRAKGFAIWKSVFPGIVEHCESLGVNIAIEPWPGPPPHYPTLGCTPEMWRAMFEVVPSATLGLCYDPSHMVRLGIDHLRVLSEFGDRVNHVHAKDCAILEEDLYVQGSLTRTFGKPVFKFGEGWWRYCKPGDGLVDWRAVVVGLRGLQRDAIFSIELEDSLYTDDAESNKAGLLASRDYLRSVID